MLNFHQGMFGKLLGTIIGVAVGLFLETGPWVLLLGLAGGMLGHLAFDLRAAAPNPQKVPQVPEPFYSPAPPSRERPRDTETSRELADTLCPLFVEVARADGPVSQDEIRVIREYFTHTLGFDESELIRVRQNLKDCLQVPPGDLVERARAARKHLAPNARLRFVETLYQLANIDANITRAESEAIKQVTVELNLSDDQHAQIAQATLGSGAAYYEVLGLTETASEDELRSAYRRLASEFHPDRFIGRPATEVEAAQARFRAVTEAFGELKKIRGL
jgi:DnaJ like chaperone protein